MATIPLTDESLPLETGGVIGRFDPLLELNTLDIFDVEDAESRPREQGSWGYWVPCPGVRYYFFE